MNKDWKLVADCFGMDFRDVLIGVLPDLEVDTAKLRQQPTPGDPLGNRSRLKIQKTWDHNNHRVLIQLQLDGFYTPFLTAEAMRVYALIEWPDLFRVRDRAWNTKKQVS